MFLQFTISSGNKFQSLMVAGKKECLKVSVVQMGSLSDFELLIRVFLELKCRCVSAGIAICYINNKKLNHNKTLVATYVAPLYPIHNHYYKYRMLRLIAIFCMSCT